MNETEITQYISNTFASIYVLTADDNHFYYYSPEGIMPERTFPLATLVTNDEYDTFSNLNRQGVFRLNVGVSKATYQAIFGGQQSDANDTENSGYDFTALDQIMPHPIYGRMYWISVLNPSDTTFQSVQPLLAEAYEMAVSTYNKRNPSDKT